MTPLKSTKSSKRSIISPLWCRTIHEMEKKVYDYGIQRLYYLETALLKRIYRRRTAVERVNNIVKELDLSTLLQEIFLKLCFVQTFIYFNVYNKTVNKELPRLIKVPKDIWRRKWHGFYRSE